MTSVRAGIIVIAVFGSSLCLVSATSKPQTRPPTFRAMSSVVAVDVSVRKGNTPVPNLTAADFTLADNGVPQTIDAVQIEAVPVDVTVAIDVSGSTRMMLERYRSDVTAIAGLLRPVDRLRVMSFGTDVDEVVPLQPIVGRPPLDRLVGSSASAVYDGIVAAMLRPVDIDRRHLVVVFTDGCDNRSITSPEALMAAARRTEAVVHLITPRPMEMTISSMLRAGLAWEAVSLDGIAEITGGTTREPARSWFTEPGGAFLGDFKRIFSDFRQSYVLRFTPTGVTRPGWHDLTVGVTLNGKYTIRARRGYSGG